MLVFYSGHEPARTDLLLDPAENPLYAGYEFGVSNTIYVGTQPLFSPTGLISEAMRHDLILEEDLRGLGLEIKFHPFLKGYDVNHFLNRGQLQAGIGGDMPTLTIAAASEVVIPVKIQDGQTWLMAKQSFLLKELKGKRIGYAVGSNAHYMLLNLLASAGLSVADVKLVSMPVNDMPDALERGIVAAFAAWEPIPSIAEMKFGFSRGFAAPSSGYMYFTKVFARNRPEAMRAIVASAARSIAWLRADKINRLLASDWNIVIANVLTNTTYPLSKEEDVSVAERDLMFSFMDMTGGVSDVNLSQDGRLAKEFFFLKDIGKIDEGISWEKVSDSFDPKILDEILGDPNGLRSFKW
jgi:ABC-type taurine transport system substrate-binding protein